MGHDGLCLATLARLGRFFFPGQDLGPGFSLWVAPSGRGGLGEMDGCAPLLITY